MNESAPTAPPTATEEVKERAQHLLHEADVCIRANPVPAVLTAFGIGFAIGVLTRYIEPAPPRDRWQDALDDLRSALASSAQRGKKAYSHSADAVRDAVEHAVEKAREIDVDPVARWWKKLWS